MWWISAGWSRGACSLQTLGSDGLLSLWSFFGWEKNNRAGFSGGCFGWCYPYPSSCFNIKQSQSNRKLSGCLFLQKGEIRQTSFKGIAETSVPLLGFSTAGAAFLSLPISRERDPPVPACRQTGVCTNSKRASPAGGDLQLPVPCPAFPQRPVAPWGRRDGAVRLSAAPAAPVQGGWLCPTRKAAPAAPVPDLFSPPPWLELPAPGWSLPLLPAELLSGDAGAASPGLAAPAGGAGSAPTAG